MVRIAKKTDLAKLAELKKKVNDDKYMQLAINKIALTLSSEILNLKEDLR